MSKQISKQKTKKGGPYTDKEKTERQNKVFHMHFDNGYSAVSIAEKLGVNRNTVSSDINKLYLQLADEMPEQDVSLLFLSQIRAMRSHKAKILEKLESQNDVKYAIMLDRIIQGIDKDIAQMLVKLMTATRRPRKSIGLGNILEKEKETPQESLKRIREGMMSIKNQYGLN